MGRQLVLTHLGIVYQELLQHILVERTGLRVTEGSLLQDGVNAGIDDGLNLTLCNGQTQFLGFGLNQLVVDIRSPHFVLDTVGLVIVQRIDALRKLHHFGVLFHQCLILLSGKALSVHFTYFL